MSRHKKQSWSVSKSAAAKLKRKMSSRSGCRHEPVKFKSHGKTVSFQRTLVTPSCPPRYERPTAAQKAQHRLAAGALISCRKAGRKSPAAIGGCIRRLLSGR